MMPGSVRISSSITLSRSPPHVASHVRVRPAGALAKVQTLSNDIDRYMYLRTLQRDRSAEFNRLLVGHTETILPYIYTPTVGEACARYDELRVPTYGLYIRYEDRGRVLEKLRAHSQQDARVVVVTDGERILGLGDLGAGGMGISEGKSLLYTAAAGVPPHQVLPVCLDVGTNRASLLESSSYTGLRRRRVTGADYAAFLDEFVDALRAWRPHLVLQFEDFGSHTAFELLERHRGRLACFNDDIQGTACVALAGLLSALRATGQTLAQQRILFLGAGEAGTGIGELVARGAERWHGLSRAQGRALCHFMDSRGLVTAARAPEELAPHKRAFAHDVPSAGSLLEAVGQIRPTALVGVSTQGGAFTREVLELMAELNERPVVFPLSNPTSKSECTFEDAYDATAGRVLFASGSPFAPLADEAGELRKPAQANNAYVFPAVGHAAVLARAARISDDAFLVAAEALAAMSDPAALARGALFPPFSAIRDVSARLIAAIAAHMVRAGDGSVPDDFLDVLRREGSAREPAAEKAPSLDEWEVYARAHFYTPVEPQLVSS